MRCPLLNPEVNDIADLHRFVPAAFLSRGAKHWRLATIQLVDLCVRFDLVRVAVYRIAAPARIIAGLRVRFRVLSLTYPNDLPRFWVCLRFLGCPSSGQNKQSESENE